MKDRDQIVALAKCFFCQKDDKILISRRLKDVSSLHGMIVDMEPCAECKALMEKGIIVIGIDEEKSGADWRRGHIPNPYRSGHWMVMSEDFIVRMCNNVVLCSNIVKRRWTFMPSEICAEILEAEEQRKQAAGQEG